MNIQLEIAQTLLADAQAALVAARAKFGGFSKQVGEASALVNRCKEAVRVASMPRKSFDQQVQFAESVMNQNVQEAHRDVRTSRTVEIAKTDWAQVMKDLALADKQAADLAAARSEVQAWLDTPYVDRLEGSERKALNSFLRKHGYVWERLSDEEAEDVGYNFNGVGYRPTPTWRLRADGGQGRIVTVEEALTTIANRK